MRNKASSSMQKTYDECYLVCSTAVYFEGQVCGSSSSERSIDPPADHDLLDRTTKQRRYGHGVLHLIRSTITMLTGSRQTTSRSRRPRGRCRNHFGIWNCSVRNVWISWKRCEGVGRRPKIAETGPAAARHREAGRRYPRSLIILWEVRPVQDGLEKELCLQ